MLEAATEECSIENVFLKISQIHKKSTYAEVSL